MNNPLISPSKLKNAAVPFNLIQPEHFAPALDAAIKKGEQILEGIRRAPASFDNTFRALETCTEELEFVFLIFNNLLGADSNDELQKLSMELGPRVSSFANDILLDPLVFTKVEEVYRARAKMALEPEQIRLVEKVYRDFQRSGAGLDDKKKARLREIDERMSQLSPKFRDNVLKSTNLFELWIDAEKDLAGLPPSAVAQASEAAAAKGKPGKWLFTLHQPSYLPFIRYADNRALREKMSTAFNTRAMDGDFDNQPVIKEIVALSEEKAKLLGSPSYAAYALQLRMAETPETVMSFLGKLLKAGKPSAERELSEVQKFASSLGGPSQLQPWDFAYYSEKLKEKTYAFDEETLRPYFKLENVIGGVFEHAKRLFGLNFVETKEYPVYHQDVRVFEVYKVSPEKEFIGLFYADFFPRASKSQGAWMTNFYEQGVFRGQRMRPHVSIVCNFTKPAAGQPSLLTFDEVSTLFHEFGHGLHSLLSQVKYRTLAGTNVFLDFVELPSQILENWAEESESLKLFAFHYKTGEVIPQELVEKLKRAQKFQVGWMTLRQLIFAFLDMAWYSNPPAADAGVLDFERKTLAPYQILPQPPRFNISTAFMHIFGGGYASGYYSYKWAEVLDADAFEMFQENGIFHKETAARFEEFILSKGNSEHPMRLYEKFRGRAPDPEALLRRDGLLN